MPVETEISCAFPEPGWQSRLIDTEICVSFVLRSIVAVRAAMADDGVEVSERVRPSGKGSFTNPRKEIDATTSMAQARSSDLADRSNVAH